MAIKKKLLIPGVAGITLLLTFVIPSIMWFVRDVLLYSMYSELAAGTFVISCALIWYGKTRIFSLLPSSPLWKVFCLIGGIITLVLIFINILNEPVSRITGQARPPLSVISVIVLLPAAEELIFRGFLWSLFERLSSKHSSAIIPLLVTSLLFGIGHLGYWVQSHWPLPPAAIFHVLLMMIAGIFFGVFRWASDSLAAPIFAHIAANGAILLFQ